MNTGMMIGAMCVLPVLLCAGSAGAVDCSLWVEHSAAKILRDAVPGERASADLCAARREWESFQIALRTESASVTNVRVEASGLKQVGGKGVIPAECVALNLVEYVSIPQPANVPYPDPLPPLRPFDLKPKQTQPVYVTVKVPEDCPPGDYEGEIAIKATGMPARKVPVKLHVWGFALPVTPKCATAFGLSMDSVARVHGVTGDAARTAELHKKYYGMLLDYKVSCYYIPVDLQSPEAKSYLADPRMTSYMIPYLDNDDKLREMVEYLAKNNWFRKGYFYPIDEPVNRASYDSMAAIAKRLRSIEPRYRLVVPFFRGPDFDESKTIWDLAMGQVNIWCPNEHYFDLQKRTRAFMQLRRNMGDDVWWYVCCGPGAPYANFFVDYPGMRHRMLFWHQKRENVDGLLYWSTTYWNPASGCDDPWKTMQTVKDINPNLSGDGSLLYPGKPVGIDGPVASLRLAIIRDGIEDFDYLCLAEELLGTRAVNGYIRRIAKDLQDYTTDPWAMEKVRRQLGAAIEKALR